VCVPKAAPHDARLSPVHSVRAQRRTQAAAEAASHGSGCSLAGDEMAGDAEGSERAQGSNRGDAAGWDTHPW